MINIATPKQAKSQTQKMYTSIIKPEPKNKTRNKKQRARYLPQAIAAKKNKAGTHGQAR